MNDKIILIFVFALIFGLTIPTHTITIINADFGEYTIKNVKTFQQDIPFIQYYNLKYSKSNLVGNLKLNITVIDETDKVVFNTEHNLNSGSYDIKLPIKPKKDYNLIMELEDYPQTKMVVSLG